MKIYTRTGDKGTTGLIGGQRVPKNALRVEAYGTLDELNAAIGLALAWLPPALVDSASAIRSVQRTLFKLGTELATPAGAKKPHQELTAEEVTFLEKAIDQMTEALPSLQNFILPGGHPASAQLHVARTVARRAERLVVSLQAAERLDLGILEYLNRLSDYLFVLARYVNQQLGTPDWPAADDSLPPVVK